METVKIEAKKRDKLGKYHSKKFKKEGFIPAVIYGEDINEPILLNEKDFNSIFEEVGEHTILKINVDGKDRNVLIRSYQDHPVTRKLMHVDFYKVSPKRKVKTRVPVHSTGLAVGVKMGGLLRQYIHALHIECLPDDIPHEIVLDVTDLQIKDGIYIRDLNLGDKIKVFHEEDQAIFLVQVTRSFEEELAEEEAAEGEEGEEGVEGAEGEEAASEETSEE